jgi:hypothetical protein
MNFGNFSKLGEKNKFSLNSRLNGYKDTLYVLDKGFFKKNGTKKNLFISMVFCMVFVGLRTTNFGIFLKLAEKNKKPFNFPLNGSKDTPYVLDRKF